MATILQPRWVADICRGALKALIRSRPGSLGNFVRMYSCCALRNFQGPTSELLPIALPEDTPDEEAAMDRLLKVAESRDEISDETWKDIDQACEKAGKAACTPPAAALRTCLRDRRLRLCEHWLERVGAPTLPWTFFLLRWLGGCRCR